MTCLNWTWRSLATANVLGTALAATLWRLAEEPSILTLLCVSYWITVPWLIGKVWETEPLPARPGLR